MTSRAFSLAGLLRLRSLEEEQAGARLSSANNRSQVLRTRQSTLRDQLTESPVEVNSTQALRYAAIARASMSGMLADLHTLEEAQDAETESARAAFAAARSRTAGLEKLQTRHNRRIADEDLAAEQTALDEIASGARHQMKERSL